MVPKQAQIMIQTLAMPADTNPNGDIFGGWLVSQMDLAAGILAKKISGGRTATVAIHSMSFLKPVHVGDLVACHVELKKIGKTSMTLEVEVWSESLANGERVRVTEGVFIFVALDEQGQPREVPKQV